MLKVRIIPTLLCKDFGLVKGKAFDSWRHVGTILPAITVYNKRQVDELIVLDINATKKNEPPDHQNVKDFSSECFIPLTVGGGVKSILDIQNLLNAGADKVCINSAALENPLLVKQASEKFGTQCIVISIDACQKSGFYHCVSHSGTRSTNKDPVSWAKEVEALGAGEILITSIERDGTMTGYDIELIKQISQAVSIPVIASGGAGNYHHMYQAITQGNVAAVAAASMFLFTHQTPLEAKQYLATHNIPVRIIQNS